MAGKLTLDRSAMKDRSTAHLRIYVGGITENATIDDIYEHFIPFGQINGIVTNRGFGFVQFQEESSAIEAIKQADGSVFQGKQLTVKPTSGARREPDQQQQQQQQKQQQEQQQEQEQSPQDQKQSQEEPAKTAVEHTSNVKPPPTNNEDAAEELYDNHGNYIGDQQRTKTVLSISLEYEDRFREDYREPEQYDNYRAERGGPRGRGMQRGRGKPQRGRGGPPAGFRDRSPIRRGGEWNDRPAYDRYMKPMPEYPRTLPMPERNDCEIIVVSKALTEYAEYLESRLKRLGIVVDLLFPMEDVPIGKVLGNIASRGCLYAILVMPTNQEHRSLTLTILHGLPQEHRNMPVEDALTLLSRNFAEVQRGGSTGREAVYALLGQLADGRTLTALQYDKVIDYLQERREQQVKVELGEPLAATTNTKTQVDLQQRILSILNDKKETAPTAASVPVPVPVSAPAAADPKNKLLNDPTVKKALDSILHKFL